MELTKPDIYVLYGTGMAALADLDEAERQFRNALALDPAHSAAHIELAKLCLFHGNTQQAQAHLDLVLAQNANCAEALFHSARILLSQYRNEQALECYRAAAVTAPNSAGLLAAAMETLFTHKQHEEVNELRWLLWEHRFQRGRYRAPQWQGEPLQGKTLLVYTEGGFGDTLQLSRYLPLIKPLAQGRVVLECQKELAELLSLSGQTDAVVVRNIHATSPACTFDLEIGFADLPFLFAARGIGIPRVVPYLMLDPERTAAWKARLAWYSGCKVGLRWAGNPTYPDDATRSCHLFDFAQLAGLSEVTFFSLQKGAREEEARRPPEGMRIVDLAPEIHDFTDTAAILSNVDLLISTDTGVPHLAGALGVPTWLVLDANPNHRWGQQGDRSAWYPSLRLFRQTRQGNWRTVMEAMAAEFQKEKPGV